jgi:hypothetical protein
MKMKLIISVGRKLAHCEELFSSIRTQALYISCLPP